MNNYNPENKVALKSNFIRFLQFLFTLKYRSLLEKVRISEGRELFSLKSNSNDDQQKLKTNFLWNTLCKVGSLLK